MSRLFLLVKFFLNRSPTIPMEEDRGMNKRTYVKALLTALSLFSICCVLMVIIELEPIVTFAEARMRTYSSTYPYPPPTLVRAYNSRPYCIRSTRAFGFCMRYVWDRITPDMDG
jgi:hypothetical protein